MILETITKILRLLNSTEKIKIEITNKCILLIFFPIFHYNLRE
jgi:hypothetical protein